ncbi:hypothetical protein NADE_005091 [Nannochloris sp. 'desiccata']|nr:hypothetical protein KSW81_001958 [Chlorella desiccata (nom. nud.)]KAH7622506.1 hypothetical protein NADE_005091 [Chlorella desiccata (nom. nud.)]
MGSLQCTFAAHPASRSHVKLNFKPLPCLRTWKPLYTQRSPQKRSIDLTRARSLDDIAPVPAATLPALNSVDDIEIESLWISGMIRCWLDDEWTPLEVHRELGQAAARAYMEVRQEGVETEVGDVVLGLGAELLVFNFRECFVGPFDVANKVAELLMLNKLGCEVCCVSDKDIAAIKRWEAIVEAELENRQ